MSNLAYRHWHACRGCDQSWECFMPGGCREDKEKTCRYCDDEEEDGEEDEE